MLSSYFKGKQSASQTQQILQSHFKLLLNQYPKLPVPNPQLYEVYFSYRDDNNLDDKDSKLLQKINQANQKSIFSEFKSFMHKVFQSLDTIFPKLQNTLDLSQLDEIVSQNAPSFIQQEVSKSRLNKLSQSSLFKSGFTPVGQVQNEKISAENKEDLIFGYLFEKIYLILNNYKNYYQLENLQDLETQIYLSFSSYLQESFPELSSKQRISSNQIDTSLKSAQQKFEQKQQKQKEKSDLVDEIMDVLLNNAEEAQLIKKNPSNSKDIASLKIKDYQVAPLKVFGSTSQFLGKVYRQGLTKTLTTVFHYARQKSIKNSVSQKMSEQAEELSFKLYETILQNHKRHNLTKDYGLPVEQFKLVEEFMEGVQKNDEKILDYLYSEQEKQNLIMILKDVVQSPEVLIHYQHVVYKVQGFIKMFMKLPTKESQSLKDSTKLNSSKKGIKTTLSTINTISQLPNTFYFIVFLYKTLSNKYSPASRRIIIRVCHEVQDKFKLMQTQEKEFRRFSLVHSLKLLEGQHTKRSQLCKIITNQKPFRQSQLPLAHQKKIYFEQFNKEPFFNIQEAQQNLEVQLARIHIQQHKKKFKEVPKLQLLKLTHSKFRKTVTILISGFLSEDTNKFQEWMGILEPTYDSQVYALKWESKTIENILAYTIDTCKDIALAGAGVGLIGGPYLKAAMVLKQIITKYNQNPFTPCFDVATITGVFLADLLISLFDGHFINLAGFSLGTQVIASTLHRLKTKGKLHMINRVITMGGVADKKQMEQIFENNQQDEQSPIQISWTNVYCEQDNILKYILRLSMPSIDPIGLSPFISQNLPLDENTKKEKVKQKKKKTIYETDNINVTQFIDGHLLYRANMKNIARLIGIKDQ